MDADRIDPRKERGLALVKGKGKSIKHVAGNIWFVPSQTVPGGGYAVDAGKATCSCPDFETTCGKRCKHLWAVLYVRREVAMPDGTTVVSETVHRIAYSQHSSYNQAQCEEKDRVQILLHGLCDGIVQPKQERGRPRVALRDVVYGATMKVYGTMSGRRSMSDLRASERDNHVTRAPSYNSIFRYIERPELMPLFKSLVNESAKPLRAIEDSFAIDSTSFATTTYARWFDHKYGQENKTQRWVKAHVMVGTRTNIMTAVEATDNDVGDSTMFKPLIEETAANGFTLKEVSADKAYLSHANLALVEQYGAAPFVPFKSNSSSTGSPAWERMYHLFSADKEYFATKYHKRSNVEASFGAMKKKFGAAVRSKLLPAQLNEVLLKCLCFNLSILVHSIHELGIDPKFWTAMAPKTPLPEMGP